MRQFYWLIEKGVAMPHFLSWTHIMALIPINNVNKINYYIKIAETQNLSYRKLREQIKFREYERLDEKTKEKKEHIGQIKTYMNIIDENLRTINQGPTIGIIVCKKKNGYLFKYVTNKNIYEREYELI